MVKLRKAPLCRGTLGDGEPCGARVEHVGECCHVCLERLATTSDTASRRELAQAADLPVQLFLLLGSDPDDGVRRILARRADCPLVVLQHLEQDEDPEVRAEAGTALSTALSPRLLQQLGNQGLFTRAEVEAFGRPDGGRDDSPVRELAVGPTDPTDRADPVPTARPPRPADRIRRVSPGAFPDAPAAGIGEVLARLEALGERMSSLEAVLSSAGERLGSISDRLEALAGADAISVPTSAAHAKSDPPDGHAATDLLPVPCAAELGTGPVIRADVVAAAWLSIIPLLARRRGGGMRLSPASVAREPVAGPLLPARSPAVAELATTTEVLDADVVDLLGPELASGDATFDDAPGSSAGGGTRVSRGPKHRRHAVHARWR